MENFEDRKMIEALRSGIPSRAVGAFFSSAREEQIAAFTEKLEAVVNTGESASTVFLGRYGEGKSHMLSTIRSIAENRNMVVSLISFSAETPANNLALMYNRIIKQTWLPGAVQPGFAQALSLMGSGSDKAQEILAWAKDNLSSDKLYYVFKAFLEARKEEDQYTLLEDLEGRFAPFNQIRSIFNSTVKDEKLASYQRKFLKTKNVMDYFRFMAHLFKALGYSGWTILFDEAELIGSLGRVSRMKAYENFHAFMYPDDGLDSLYSVFAFSTSYNQDIIVEKDEYTYLEAMESGKCNKDAVRLVLDTINSAVELKALSQDELATSILQIINIYRKAYDFYDSIDSAELTRQAATTGYLLRTKIRAAIEYLDQIQLYGSFSPVKTRKVDTENLKEEIADSELEQMLEDF